MRFSTIFTVLAAGAMAFASAVPAKRSASDIQSIFNNLSGNCDTILSKLDSCQDDSCTSEIVGELASAIDGCTTTLGGTSGGPADTAVSNAVADVVNKIANGLNSHKNNCGSGCSNSINTTYAKVDSSLSSCLRTAFGLSTGLEALVHDLLVNLVGILQTLSFSATLSACSLP